MSEEIGRERAAIAKRLAKALADRDLSQADVARDTGRSRSTVHGWLNGRAQPPLEVLAKWCEARGVDPNYLLGLKVADEPVPVLMNAGSSQGGGLAALPMVGFSLSGGMPRLEETREHRLYAFHETFLRRLHTHNPGVFKIKGDSMHPTIRDGAVVLVDRRPITELRHLSHRAIYVVNDPNETGGATVKRVIAAPAGLLLLAENPEHPPIQVPLADQHRLQHVVLGRVVWVGQEVE